MKNFILILVFSIAFISEGQTDNKSKDSIKVVELYELYQQKTELIKIEKDSLRILKNSINESSNNDLIVNISKKLDIIKYLKYQLDSIYNEKETLKDKYFDMSFSNPTTIEMIPPKKEEVIEDANTNNEEIKTYSYFGKDLVISEAILDTSSRANKVLKNILNQESESYLGDIIIPKHLQLFNFYKYDNKKRSFKINNEIYKFKSIELEIREGEFYDIKVIVYDKDDNELLFENTSPVGLIRYSKKGPKNYILFRHVINAKKLLDYKEYYRHHRIRLSDVLKYISKPGNNYIPKDINLEFPTKNKNGELHNINSALRYQLKVDTRLQSVIELRTYTDALSLISDTPNGIIQFEGKADFFILPNSMGNETNFKFFNKISPYVNFSKFDDDKKFVEISPVNSMDTLNLERNISKNLDVLQKSYLEMGAVFNLYSFRINKEYPFSLNFYAPVRYNIAQIKTNDRTEDFKSLAFGLGMRLETKRFNNFKFNYSIDFTEYKYKEFNTIENLINPNANWVMRNEAEIAYHPDKKKDQSIFLRLRTFNNSRENNSESFFQFQFGYKFTIGINKN